MKAIQRNENLRLPRRLRDVQPTLIRRIFERALPDSINFGLGEPDLPTPDFMRREAARVALEEQNGYTSHAGLLPLRERIAASYPHLNLDANQVCVTVGSQEAMTVAFLAIVDEGDEVLIPNPSFPAYENCVKISGGEPVFYRLPAERDFAFDIEEFKSKITEKTKVAVVISPSNPTGKIFTPEDLQAIADVLKDTGIYLISDEIYSDLYFTENAPRSASEFYERTVIVSGLSKSLSMTGWRVGWVASSQTDVVKAALTLHGFLTVCTSTISQKAALLGWTDEAEQAKRDAREIYKRRGEFLIDTLNQTVRAGEVFDRAVALSEEVAGTMPENAKVQTRLARTYFVSGKFWKSYARAQSDAKMRGKSCELLQKSFDLLNEMQNKGTLSEVNAGRTDQVAQELSDCQ